MTITITSIITILAFGMLAYTCRGFWANNRTYSDRMEIIYALTEASWPVDESLSFGLVQYKDHYREIFWGRDPLSLYSRGVMEILKTYRNEEALA